ncbi:AMP-binding protein [Streptomyces sp. NPDC047108]|uniref:AMP-binding protein n=1 Tax=Streptomyces sp. NPDC047108 TaxID=3155025 RepID=UPI0033E753FC
MEATLKKDFVSILRQRARTAPDSPAFTFLEGELNVADTLTYGELDRRAASLAARLRETLSPGDRALLLHPAGLDYVVAFYACLYARVIAVPLYVPQRRTVATVQAIAEDCRAAAVLTTARNTRRRSLFTAGAGPSTIPWLTTDTDAPGTPDADPPSEEITPETVAYLQYTSGSTSAPKGVVITHHNAVRQCDEAATGWAFGADSCWVAWLPHFHDYGQIGSVMLPVFAGARSVMMAPATFVRRPLRWLRAISAYRGTHTGAPNFAYDLCVEAAEEAVRTGAAPDLDLCSLVTAGNGAEPVHADTLERFARAFTPYGLRPGVLCPSYGLAEATLRVTSHPVGEPYRAGTYATASPGAPVVPTEDTRVRPLVAAGSAVGDTEVAVVDPKTRRRLPDGHVGEIWVAGPIVSPGYWERPEENARTFRAEIEGESGRPHLRTGDLGFLLDGALHICGRSKDVVIVNGANHYPQDIERTAEDCHPAVRRGRTVAFGVADGTGESLVVVVELTRSSDGPPADVAREIREAVWRAHDLAPTVVVAETGAVPITTSGKVQRRRCREDFISGRLPALARPDAATVAAVTAGRTGTAPRSAPSAAAALRESCLARITGWLADQVPAGTPVDTGQTFSAYGMASLQLMELHTLLEDWIGSELPPELLWESESIDDLAGQVTARLVQHGPKGTGR